MNPNLEMSVVGLGRLTDGAAVFPSALVTPPPPIETQKLWRWVLYADETATFPPLTPEDPDDA